MLFHTLFINIEEILHLKQLLDYIYGFHIYMERNYEVDVLSKESSPQHMDTWQIIEYK